MPAPLLQCHRLQCAARALLRRALRSGHVAALGPFRGARAMLLRSGPRLRLLRCVAVLVVFPLVLRLVCAGLFAMSHIGTQDTQQLQPSLQAPTSMNNLLLLSLFHRILDPSSIIVFIRWNAMS